MSKEDFKDVHMLKLQGKDYLPVAPRVVLFRAEHPDHSILTETRTVAEDVYVFAAITNEKGFTLATAHKRVRKDARGPAGQWPLETAETGAIGRALALCGYGTLSGDLDEGDELADAPVEPVGKVGPKPTSKAKPNFTKNATGAEWILKLDSIKTLKEFDAEYDNALEYLETVGKKSEEYAEVYQAVVRAGQRVGKTRK